MPFPGVDHAGVWEGWAHSVLLYFGRHGISQRGFWSLHHLARSSTAAWRQHCMLSSIALPMLMAMQAMHLPSLSLLAMSYYVHFKVLDKKISMVIFAALWDANPL